MSDQTANIRKAYDAAASAYAEQFLSELQHKPLDRELLSRFSSELGARARVLDVGCGPGHTTAHLASLGLDPIGVDLAPQMIEMAKLHFPDLEFNVADFFALPFEDCSFAGGLAFYCIVHLQREQLATVFAEMYRVLKPGGLLFLSFHVGTESVLTSDFLGTGAQLEFFPFPVEVVSAALKEARFAAIESQVRPPYDTEYPSQRCYIFARKHGETIAAP